jgi:hypothetical protein
MTSVAVWLVLLTNLRLAPLVDPDLAVDRPVPPPAKRDLRVVREAAAIIVRWTHALDTVQELTKESVQAAIGIPLMRVDGRERSNPQYAAFIPSGPFRFVFFRHAGPASASWFALVGIGVREEAQVEASDFSSEFLGARGFGNPFEGRGPTVERVVVQPNRERSFMFRLHSGALLSMSLLRGKDPHRWRGSRPP